MLLELITSFWFILSLLMLILLLWSRIIKNWLFHFKKKKAFYGSLILCRERLIFSSEVIGIALLAIKLLTFAPDQSDYNDLLAKTTLANVHATSEIYRIMRRDIPFKLPDNFSGSQLKLPENLIQGDSTQIYGEVDQYIRIASKTLSGYFGNKVPECRYNNIPIRIVSTSPDSELVNIELNRLAKEKGFDCSTFKISTGLFEELSYRALNEARLEIIGILFVLLALIFKFIELRHKENKRQHPKQPKDWFWDENQLHQ